MNKTNFKFLCECALDFAYPKKCIMCGKTVKSFGSVAICPACAEKVAEPKVVRDDKYMFDEALCALKYEGNVRRAMLEFKFHGVKYCGAAFAQKIYEAFKNYPIMSNSLLCCVPMGASRDRRYNQAEVIAASLAELCGLPFEPALIRKVRDIKTINNLKRADRAAAIFGAFDLDPSFGVGGKTVVMVDDIFTTGSTANECARILKMYGAERVGVVCACYD